MKTSTYSKIFRILLSIGLSKEKIKKQDFRWADFRWADFRGADFSRANFSGANFIGADFIGANFIGANFRWANFSGADFRGADFRGADFRGADFRGADFSRANFSGANFSGANFSGADLNYIISVKTIGLTINCPETGSFIGYKKCKGLIVTLKITEDAKRSSATTYKCRCSKAEVIEIETGLTEIASDYDSEFIYKVGEIVEVSDFDENRWNECSTGIHFFTSKQMAKNYN